MQTPVDYYTDANQQRLYTIDRLYGLPNFVKGASAEPPKKIAELRSNVFADVKQRRFPCHNKSATWLAQAYFSAAEPHYSKKEAAFIQDRIFKASEFFGISGLCEGFRKAWLKLASQDIPELEDSDYALVTSYEGNKIRKFPIYSPLATKQAGEYLYANRFKYPYEWRKTAARNILKRTVIFDKKAAAGVTYAGAAMGECAFSEDTQDWLERASGYGMSFPKQAGEKLAMRVLMLSDHKHTEIKEKLAKIAQALMTMDVRHVTPDFYQKVAAVVDGVDRESGIYNYYHEGVELPEDIFFDILQKTAEATLNGNVSLTTGNSYPVSMFEDLPLSKISEVLGDEFADAVSNGLGQVDAVKFAEIARTLPRPDAALLERAIKAGMKEAAMVKDARAGNQANNRFTKESIREQLKQEGKTVADEDFTLSAKIKHS